MDRFEGLNQKFELPFELLVDLSSQLIAQLRFMCFVELIIVNKFSHKLFNTE